MKERIVLLISFLIIWVMVSTAGCIENPSNSSQSFHNNAISFNYPAQWVTFSEFWPSTFGFEYNYSFDEDLNATEMVGVLNPDSGTYNEKFSTSVMIKTRPSAGDLKSVFEATYALLAQQYNATYREVSERTLTLDGVTAYEKVYQLPHGEPYYQIREIWLEKNHEIYIISCKSFISNYNESQTDFNLIINSFHVE